MWPLVAYLHGTQMSQVPQNLKPVLIKNGHSVYHKTLLVWAY